MNKEKSLVVLMGIIFLLFVSLIIYKSFKKEELVKENANNAVYRWETGSLSKDSPAYILKRRKLKAFGGLYKSNIKKEGIFLTFDTGYDAGYINYILDVLKKNNVKAAFFVTNEFLTHDSSSVERMIKEGHIVGNHTENHYDMSTLSSQEIKDEILSVHNRIYEMFGYRMEYLRPPSGIFNDEVLKVSQTLGYKLVLWEFAYDDWNENRQMSMDAAKKELFENVSYGDVVLLHATSKVNASILDDVIKEFSKKRYKFYTLDEYE